MSSDLAVIRTKILGLFGQPGEHFSYPVDQRLQALRIGDEENAHYQDRDAYFRHVSHTRFSPGSGKDVAVFGGTRAG